MTGRPHTEVVRPTRCRCRPTRGLGDGDDTGLRGELAFSIPGRPDAGAGGGYALPGAPAVPPALSFLRGVGYRASKASVTASHVASSSSSVTVAAMNQQAMP